MRFIKLVNQTMLYIIFAVLISVTLYLGYYFFMKKEGFTNGNQENIFLKEQEKYYEGRIDEPIITDDSSDFDIFYKISDHTTEEQTPTLVKSTPDTTLATTNVDQQVKKCKSIKSCDELEGTQCGYCLLNDTFYYGNDKGPFTDVCPGGWVKTKEQCQERQERSICEKVKSCNEMVGDADICAWCPTSNKAMPYKMEGSIAVPKYDIDKCNDIDILNNNKKLGLVLQKQCKSFDADHPCIGPNENSGPHSKACLKKLWKAGGCPSTGSRAPGQTTADLSWWNTQSWKNVLIDMQNWFKDANSKDWSLVKTHYKGCYGKDPDPCNSKYNSTPLECYQQIFTKSGCFKKGAEYPTKIPSMTKSSFESYVTELKNGSHNKGLPYSKQDKFYNQCYGGHLTPPPTIKVGDYVKTVIDYPKFGGKCNLFGYVCEVVGGKAKIFWEELISDNNKSKDSATRKYHLNNRKFINEYLGSYCGQIPQMLKGVVDSQISLDELTLVSSCKQDTNCPDSGCNMQNIVLLSKTDQFTYSISRNEVDSIINNIRQYFANSRLCEKTDLQFLVDSNLSECSFGWISDNGILYAAYPSVRGTSSGCGDGKVEVILGGASFEKNRANMYMIIDANPEILGSELKKLNLYSKIVATVGKTSYLTESNSGVF